MNNKSHEEFSGSIFDLVEVSRDLYDLEISEMANHLIRVGTMLLLEAYDNKDGCFKLILASIGHGIALSEEKNKEIYDD